MMKNKNKSMVFVRLSILTSLVMVSGEPFSPILDLISLLYGFPFFLFLFLFDFFFFMCFACLNLSIPKSSPGTTLYQQDY